MHEIHVKRTLRWSACNFVVVVVSFVCSSSAIIINFKKSCCAKEWKHRMHSASALTHTQTLRLWQCGAKRRDNKIDLDSLKNLWGVHITYSTCNFNAAAKGAAVHCTQFLFSANAFCAQNSVMWGVVELNLLLHTISCCNKTPWLKCIQREVQQQQHEE